MELIEHCIVFTLSVCGFLLGAAAVVGFVSSLLQAATQIQDQTLSIVPKLIAFSLVSFVIHEQVAFAMSEIFGEALSALSRVRP